MRKNSKKKYNMIKIKYYLIKIIIFYQIFIINNIQMKKLKLNFVNTNKLLTYKIK